MEMKVGVKLHNWLNQWGSEGWELVSYQAMPLMGSISQKVNRYIYLAVWKRQ